MSQDLYAKIGREELDYPALMSVLAQYAYPRAKVTTLLKSGTIIRVKKGLYVFGEKLRRRPFSRELLANLIYGPSIVSLDYALAWHGLIPERIEAVTSTTPKRCKRFPTPVGLFIYRQVPKAYFPIGMERVERGDVAFLIASPERALADKLREDRGTPLRSQSGVANYVMRSLRIDTDKVAQLNAELLAELAAHGGSNKISLLAKWVRTLRGQP